MENNRCLICNQELVIQFDLAQFLIPVLNKQRRTQSVNDGGVLCADCRQTFVLIGPEYCPQCGRHQQNYDICLDCIRWNKSGVPLVNHALFRYTDSMHDLMRRYKRYGDYVLVDALKSLIADQLKEVVASGRFDYFIPLPTDPLHVQSRGFDTITSIFDTLVPLTLVLTKESTEKPQSQKNRQERMQTKQTFVYCGSTPLSGRGLLLDDLYTTGRTFYHARDAIQRQDSNLQLESFSIIR